MKNVIAATTFAALMIAGAAMADNSFPCTKAQFWITSLQILQTVPAGAEMHRNMPPVSIAAHVLKPRSLTQLAQKSALAKSNI